MNKEEIEELKEFTIDLTDIDEIALGLEICSKKSNMVIQEFADTIIQLQQENQELKKELEEKNKPQIFIDNQDIEERYAEGLYQDYLEEENKKYKKQQKEFIDYINSYIKLLSDDPDYIEKRQKDILEEILSEYEEMVSNNVESER